MKLVNYLKTSNVYVEHTTTSYIKLMHITFALTDKKIKSKNWKICLKLGFKSYKWTTKNKLWTVFWGCWKKPFFKEKKNDQKNERYTEAGNVYDTHMICCSTSHIQNTLLRSKKNFFFFFFLGWGWGGEGWREFVLHMNKNPPMKKHLPQSLL